MNRRVFLRTSLGYGSAAAAGLLAPGSLARVWALDATNASPSPTVEIGSGKIRGLTVGSGVSSFRGIPYGAPTGGARRFLPAEKPEPWTGIREVVEFGHRCFQGPSTLIPEVAAMDRREPPGEDCLVLNVWTAGVGTGKRPVMVWLHGGGYSSASGSFLTYDGTHLAAKQDVVVVTLNHRLNVFGFLDFAGVGGEKYAKASNVGMQDIVQALQWVRDNISVFGGDPKNVTIFGQSGGGGKVSTLLAMPAAKGLFHRAIVESGSDVIAIPRDEADRAAATFLMRLELKAGQIDELQKMPPQKLVAAMSAGGPLLLGPVVDGTTLPANPFDPTAPEMSANVPLLTGSVETEVTFFRGTQLDPIDDTELHARVKQAIQADDSATDKVIAAYRTGRPGISDIDLALTVASDVGIRDDVLTQAERKAALRKAPVYMYYFTWRSPVREGKLRTFHTLELPFVFDNVDLSTSMTGTGPERQALADKISGAWAAFARTGNPNHKGLPNWPTFDEKKRATMILNNECKVVNDPNGAERLALRAAGVPS